MTSPTTHVTLRGAHCETTVNARATAFGPTPYICDRHTASPAYDLTLALHNIRHHLDMAHDAPVSPTRFAHDAPSPRPGPRRAPSNFDEGFSEETQSQLGSDVDMARDLKESSDRTMDLVRELDNLSIADRLSILRNTAGALSPEDQLCKFVL